MKHLIKLFSNKNILFFLITLIVLLKVFFLLKTNIVFAEASLDINWDLAETALFSWLKGLVLSKKFKETYGYSKNNPIFLTRFYTVIICNKKFLYKFLNDFPWQNLVSEKHHGTISSQEFRSKMLVGFYNYVNQALKDYERPFRIFFNIAYSSRLLYIVQPTVIKSFILSVSAAGMPEWVITYCADILLQRIIIAMNFHPLHVFNPHVINQILQGIQNLMTKKEILHYYWEDIDGVYIYNLINNRL